MIGYGEKQTVLYHGDHKPAEIYGPKMVKTTGAQLLDLENVIIQRGTKKLETWGVISSFTDYYFTYFYLTKEVLTYLNSHIQNGLTFSMDRNTTGRNIAIVFRGVKDGQIILDEKNSNESFVTLTPHDVDTVASVELRLNRSSTRIDVDGDEFDYLMVNEGLEPLPWEPFSHMIPLSLIHI